ncbi:hypothetical protein CL689_00370 [Candidatus Saccharibacteria bacterium]|nr:hypothetical protein [Candidatus Saccharibacteria bacterium]|tara:strand:+ start:4251 stop:4745 length:495 start_codon:yes stop_codon:yes gene_type:complete
MSAGSDLYMDDSRMSGLSRQLRSLADGAALRMQLPFVDPAHYLVALADWPNSGMPSVGKLLIDEGGLQPRHSFDSLASFYAHARVDGTPVIMLYTVYGKKMYQLAAERLQDQPLKSVSVFDLTIAALRSGSPAVRMLMKRRRADPIRLADKLEASVSEPAVSTA